MKHSKESKGNKKIFMVIVVAIIVIIGIIAVMGNKTSNESNNETNNQTSQMTKEEMLEKATDMSQTAFQELGKNTALAETRTGMIFKFSGVTYNIESDNVEIVVGDDTICKMYLPKEDLLQLKHNQDITVVGKLNNFKTKDMILTKLAYFEFKDCYIVELGTVH